VEFSSDVLTLEAEGHVATLWLDREEAATPWAAPCGATLPLAAAGARE